MADPVGVTASLIAISGLAVKISRQLDQMVQSYCDAPQVFGAFCSNFNGAQNVIAIVTKTLREHEVNESIHGLDFEKQLRDSVDGIETTLHSVFNGLSGVRRLERGNRWLFRDKVRLVWEEEQLDKWDKILDRQVNTLNTLMNAHSYYRSHLDRGPSSLKLPPSRSEMVPQPVGSADHSKELDLCDDDASDIQERAEETIATLAGSNTEDPFAPTKRQGVAQTTMDKLHQRAECLVEGHPDMKFRILLMGKHSNGKTTLCERVLGIKLHKSRDNGGSIFGTSTTFDNIDKEQTFAGKNPDLIIHDSGGFETGGGKAQLALKNFLENRHLEDPTQQCNYPSMQPHSPHRHMDHDFFFSTQLHQF